MILTILANATAALRFDSLGLDPIALDLGILQIRWYSLAYVIGIVVGWWYLTRLLREPGAPMAKRHADDLIFWATIGIIVGGRVAYILFYRPDILADPLEILRLWEGGMSFHGGVVGVSLALVFMARANGLDWLRVHDYVACCVPFGLFFGRLANFVNGELWGRVTDVPWAIVFPDGGPLPRHPSQLYEAALEGLLLFVLLWWMFWKTDARYQPGKLVGTFLLGYGVSRTLVELVREPDAGLENLWWGLSMGQTLSVPMILGGVYLIATAKGRRRRVEPVAGTESVA